LGISRQLGRTMQFLVYLTVLMVSVSTVLLEIHWLTTPPPQPRPAVQTAGTSVPRPRVEGPNAELSPVYPKRLEATQSSGNAAAGGNTEPAQRSPAETTGTSNGSGGSNQTGTGATSPPDGAQNAQAYAPQQRQNDANATAASNNSCDVQACASTYKSFRASDCTYQPFDGPRRVCSKVPEQRADREQAAEPQRRSSTGSSDVREVDRRARWRVYEEDDDDADDMFLFRRSRRW
jgi:BA14K-like protein